MEVVAFPPVNKSIALAIKSDFPEPVSPVHATKGCEASKEIDTGLPLGETAPARFWQVMETMRLLCDPFDAVLLNVWRNVSAGAFRSPA
jgi:hypothetical protein